MNFNAELRYRQPSIRRTSVWSNNETGRVYYHDYYHPLISVNLTLIAQLYSFSTILLLFKYRLYDLFVSSWKPRHFLFDSCNIQFDSVLRSSRRYFFQTFEDTRTTLIQVATLLLALQLRQFLVHFFSGTSSSLNSFPIVKRILLTFAW